MTDWDRGFLAGREAAARVADARDSVWVDYSPDQSYNRPANMRTWAEALAEALEKIIEGKDEALLRAKDALNAGDLVALDRALGEAWTFGSEALRAERGGKG